MSPPDRAACTATCGEKRLARKTSKDSQRLGFLRVSRKNMHLISLSTTAMTDQLCVLQLSFLRFDFSTICLYRVNCVVAVQSAIAAATTALCMLVAASG